MKKNSMVPCSEYFIMFLLLVNGPIVECNGNTYGMECSQTCGKCYENEQCNHLTGICPNGCDPGMSGHKCDNGIFYLIFIQFV